jgi:putative ABC transport system permease protein
VTALLDRPAETSGAAGGGAPARRAVMRWALRLFRRDTATAAGILVALGVLAMTIGLIRSETAGDIRTLTATGASARTRRGIVAATAGMLGLLGALTGTAVAYLAVLAGSRHELLSGHLSVLPWTDLAAVLVGLPVAAVIGGWLLAGREPRAIAHQALQ